MLERVLRMVGLKRGRDAHDPEVPGIARRARQAREQAAASLTDRLIADFDYADRVALRHSKSRRAHRHA